MRVGALIGLVEGKLFGDKEGVAVGRVVSPTLDGDKLGDKDDEDGAKRPVTFTFNGGPGSASLWLHMGGVGPKRVVLKDDGTATAAPYSYVPNEFSWLDKTDLVFIDPVSTG